MAEEIDQLSIRPCFLHLLDRKDSKAGLPFDVLNSRSHWSDSGRIPKDSLRNISATQLVSPSTLSTGSHINRFEGVFQNRAYVCHLVSINLKTVPRNY